MGCQVIDWNLRYRAYRDRAEVPNSPTASPGGIREPLSAYGSAFFPFWACRKGTYAHGIGHRLGSCLARAGHADLGTAGHAFPSSDGFALPFGCDRRRTNRHACRGWLSHDCMS